MLNYELNALITACIDLLVVAVALVPSYPPIP